MSNEKTMIEYILEIDSLTTVEFCDKFDVPHPVWTGNVGTSADQFLQIDAIKHRLFVQYAKELHRSKQASPTPSIAVEIDPIWNELCNHIVSEGKAKGDTFRADAVCRAVTAYQLQTAQLRQQVEYLKVELKNSEGAHDITLDTLSKERSEYAALKERNEKMEREKSEDLLESLDLTGRLNAAKEDVKHLQSLVENKNAYIDTIENMMKSVAFECYKQAVLDMTKPGDVFFEDGLSADFQDVYEDALSKQSIKKE